MTMAIAAISFASYATGGDEKGKTYTVDTKQSTLKWVGEKVTGSHYGSVTLQSGELSVEKGMIETASIVMDMNTITVEDEGMSDDMKGKLLGHLKSDDFFSVANHNSANFTLTSFKPQKGENGANYVITGQLTIKGKTDEISFPAKVTMKDDMIQAEAKLTFDRTKWDIRYGSGSFFEGLGDKMIYDDVQIEFNLVARS